MNNPGWIAKRLLWGLAAGGLGVAGGGCAPTLAGHLTDGRGQVVAHSAARVNLARLGGGGPGKSVVVMPVDGQGGFETDVSLEPGTYLVEALVPGYGLASKRIELDEAARVELVLTPLKKTKAATVGINLEAGVGRGSGGASLAPPNL